jgi:hypothetical protein
MNPFSVMAHLARGASLGPCRVTAWLCDTVEASIDLAMSAPVTVKGRVLSVAEAEEGAVFLLAEKRIPARVLRSRRQLNGRLSCVPFARRLTLRERVRPTAPHARVAKPSLHREPRQDIPEMLLRTKADAHRSTKRNRPRHRHPVTTGPGRGPCFGKSQVSTSPLCKTTG